MAFPQKEQQLLSPSMLIPLEFNFLSVGNLSRNKLQATRKLFQIALQ
ncbi:hypothetical protein SLEP1_g35905 [Rubroshorea leprosula]|uniref:Uncharacterized protein n=1 Tax=Rubroshorea leprosula TaxID=152421 RepID=A0AAV5KPR1_9ROSI|nr:hypothetical protein SLEP1_g35905 [Rubroshorea leprosula]